MIPDPHFQDLEIRCRQAVEELLAGEYLSVFKGRGIEFEDVRPYQPGDEVRSIDWNVTARTGNTYVKRFVEERDLTVYLLVDISASGAYGSQSKTKIEAAAELAGMLAYAAVKNHDRAGLVLFTDHVERHISPAKGQVHVVRMLYEILNRGPQSSGTDLRAPLDYLLHVCKRRAVVFLISDFQDAGYEETLMAAAMIHDLIAVVVTDPREVRLPRAGLIRVRDAETGKLVLIDASNRDSRRAYALAAGTGRAELNDVLESSGVDHFDLRVGADYAGELRNFLLSRLHRA